MFRKTLFKSANFLKGVGLKYRGHFVCLKSSLLQRAIIHIIPVLSFCYIESIGLGFQIIECAYY